MENPQCPKCSSALTYPDGTLWICPECGHEWSSLEKNSATLVENPAASAVIKDSNGNLLSDGDTVVVIKDLKVRGASGSIKAGTKVKNIKLLYDVSDGHDIACKVDGFGAMNLRSDVVKKA